MLELRTWKNTRKCGRTPLRILKHSGIRKLKMVEWDTPYTKVWSGSTEENWIGKWYVDGKTNVVNNGIDRWIKAGYGNETALHLGC